MKACDLSKRYQVFISSTYLDLHEERQELIRALLELDCIPAGMELFPASDDDAWTLIQRVIDESDYYLVVTAGRYGSEHPKTGTSYTEMEYDYALSKGKPIIGFLHSETGSISADKSEKDSPAREKLIAFNQKIRSRVTKEFNSPDMLAAVATRSIVQLIKQKPAIGWIRADQTQDLKIVNKIKDLELQLSEKDREVQKYKLAQQPQPIEDEMASQGLTDKVIKFNGLEAQKSTLITKILETLIIFRNSTESKYVRLNTFSAYASIETKIAADILEQLIFAMSEEDYFVIDHDDDIIVDSAFIRHHRLRKLREI